MIYKNLTHRKGRTLLAVLGISIGVAAIIGLGALTEGLQAGYGSVLTGSQADLVLRDADTIDLLVSSIDEEVGQELLVMPEVSAVSGMIQGLVQAESALYFFIFGYPEGSFALDRFQLIDGFPLYSREANEMRGKPIMLGSVAAESYNVGVGDSLRIGETAYRVVGIYETGEAFEDGGAIIRLAAAQILLGAASLLCALPADPTGSLYSHRAICALPFPSARTQAHVRESPAVGHRWRADKRHAAHHSRRLFRPERG